MNTVFAVMAMQALLGAFDNLWHHEGSARLPQRSSARRELALHAAREAVYCLLFAGFAWLRLQGAWLLLPLVLMLGEVAITIADFLEEDRSRRLPPFERVLHTVLAVGYGVLLGLLWPSFLDALVLPADVAVVSHGAWSWFFSLAGAGVGAWSARNFAALRTLRAAAAAMPALPARSLAGPAILVTGGTGFIGSAFVRRCLSQRRRVIVYTRDVMQARALFGPAMWAVDRLEDIPPETVVDAVVHLAGAPVLGLPWTGRRRQQLLDSRVHTTRALLTWLQGRSQRPQVLVAASAVGYYGVPEHDTLLDEQAPAQPSRFQSQLCIAAEHEAQRAPALGLRTVCLRFGLVLGRGGGAYAPLSFASRLGLGAVLGSGRQPVPWLHHDDAVGFIEHAVRDATWSGPVNAVAPELTTQRAFARGMAASFGRKAWLHVPGFLLRATLGEMSELLLCGQRVVPSCALRSRYRFAHPRLAEALSALAATAAPPPPPTAPAAAATPASPGSTSRWE